MRQPELPPKGLARIPEAMDYLAMSRRKIYDLMKDRDLDYVKIGKSRRIPWESLERLVSENRKQA